MGKYGRIKCSKDFKQKSHHIVCINKKYTYIDNI